jgi:hypothetical protein
MGSTRKLANITRPFIFHVPINTVILGGFFENMEVSVFRIPKVEDDSLAAG